MTVSSDRPFWDLSEAEARALAGAADAGPPVPPEYLQGVADNLVVLLGHARILAAALPAGETLPPPEPFTP